MWHSVTFTDDFVSRILVCLVKWTQHPPQVLSSTLSSIALSNVCRQIGCTIVADGSVSSQTVLTRRAGCFFRFILLLHRHHQYPRFGGGGLIGRGDESNQFSFAAEAAPRSIYIQDIYVPGQKKPRGGIQIDPDDPIGIPPKEVWKPSTNALSGKSWKKKAQGNHQIFLHCLFSGSKRRILHKQLFFADKSLASDFGFCKTTSLLGK